MDLFLVYMIVYIFNSCFFFSCLCCHFVIYDKLTFLNYTCSLLERTAWNLDKKLVTFLSILMQNWAASLAILDFLQIELEN